MRVSNYHYQRFFYNLFFKRQKTYEHLILQIKQEISEIEKSNHLTMDMNRKHDLEIHLSPSKHFYLKKAQVAHIRSRAEWVTCSNG